MRWFFIVCMAAAAAAGFLYEGKGALQKERAEVAVTEKKNFAIVLYAHNDLLFCKRALHSLFEQEWDAYHLFFVDDASEDETTPFVEAFLEETQQQQKATLIRHGEKIGPLAALYHIADTLLDREIVVFLDAKDFLAGPFALSRLNALCQDPDVWAVHSPFLSYPLYERGELSEMPFAFLAGLFKQIPLQEVCEGRDCFAAVWRKSQKGNIAFSKSPLFFRNETIVRSKEKRKEPLSAKPLQEFPSQNLRGQKVDLLLFSYDRPMQLYACLESIEKHMTGLSTITVLYRVSDLRFEAGYQKVKARFPAVHFVPQSMQEPKKDFQNKVLRTLAKTPSRYILFGVDDLIVKDKVDLSECSLALEKTGAYAFFLRFGTHIRFSYQAGCEQKRPLLFPVGDSLLAWDVKQAEADWGFPNNLDMTVYRKKEVEKALKKAKFKTPTSLESVWASEYPPEKAVGLCFYRSKVVNIPLNVIHPTGNPHMGFATPEELLTWFEEGKRIEIDPFYQIENASPHEPLIPSIRNF